MDTQYSSNKSFKLEFYQKGQDLNKLRFYTVEDDIYRNDPLLVLKENIAIEVLFSSIDEDARFYMDGLETLPEKMVEEDETGSIYRKQSSEIFKLFDYDYYPLIPGYYRIKVVENKINYYALIEIIPKQMTKKEWETMNRELECEIKGLAHELIRKNLGLGNLSNKTIPPKALYRFMVITKRFSNVMAALVDLSNKANYKISKMYKMIPTDQAKNVDDITIRYRLTHPEEDNVLKTPIRELNYDLPENQWIKRILKVIKKYLDDFIESNDRLRNEKIKLINDLSKYKEQFSTSQNIREEERVLEYLKHSNSIACKIKNAINIVKESEWYELTSEYKGTIVPHILLSDPRYSSLYKLYRELQLEEFKVDIDSKYAFQWKRTDKLYEMWGYIKIYKALTRQKLNFEVLSGWIFDKEFEENRILIPTLSSGTTIILKKEDIKLSLVYDDIIPFTSSETIPEKKPLYMKGIHNRPDGRLDVYKNDVYIGSLLFDFKYRPKINFWDTSKLNSSNKPTVMNQIIAYESQCKSPYLFGIAGENKHLKFINPVAEVWAIYPRDVSNSNVQVEKDYNLKLLKLCPNETDEHIEKCLDDVIKDIVERMHEFIK